MGANDPRGGSSGNPFEGLLNDLLKMMSVGGAAGGSPWLEAARSLAHGVATEGKPEGNADPLARIAFGELARVAELHVSEATGLPVGAEQRPVAFTPIEPGALALRILDAWAPTLTKLVDAQRGESPGHPGSPGGTGEAGGTAGAAHLDLHELLGDLGGWAGTEHTGDDLEGAGGDIEGGSGLEGLLGRLASTMGPMVLGMQFGSAAGHLAQRSLGQYALPLPWPPSNELLVVPENIARFANDWSLPLEEARLWVCVRELTAHAVLTRPHVAGRISSLLEAAARETVAANEGLAQRLGGEDADPESLQRLLADPESLLADLLSPAQRRVAADLVAATTAVDAYVDHVTASVAGSLVGSSGALAEAWYRYRTEGGTGEQAAGALFGLDLSRDQADRGAAFVRGVVERAGEEGLARLWSAEKNLPTPAELDAPGLWLERISLPGLEP